MHLPSEREADTLSALVERPAAVEPAFREIALPDADVEAADVDHDLLITVELQHELPAAGAIQVHCALADFECVVASRPLLVIGPVNRSTLLLPALPKGLFLLRRVVQVVVVAELHAIRLDRELVRKRHPADLADDRAGPRQTEIHPKLVVSFVSLRLPAPRVVARPVGPRREWAIEHPHLTGAERRRQQPSPGGQAARPEDEFLRPPQYGSWMAEFDWKVAPAARFHLFREEHNGRAGLVHRPLFRHQDRVAEEKQPAR